MERMVAPGIDSIRRDFMYNSIPGAGVEAGQTHYRSSGADTPTSYRATVWQCRMVRE